MFGYVFIKIFLIVIASISVYLMYSVHDDTKNNGKGFVTFFMVINATFALIHTTLLFFKLTQ